MWMYTKALVFIGETTTTHSCPKHLDDENSQREKWASQSGAVDEQLYTRYS